MYHYQDNEYYFAQETKSVIETRMREIEKLIEMNVVLVGVKLNLRNAAAKILYYQHERRIVTLKLTVNLFCF